MPEHYYKSDTNYLYVQKAIVERLQLFVTKMLYPDESFAVAKKRFILANFESGDEVAVRKSVEYFKNPQAQFPFTAYNVGEEEEIDDQRDGSNWATGGIYYSKTFNAYVKTIPAKLMITMMSFFSNPHDYFQARSRIYDTTSTLTRLWCPIVVNELETQFPIDIAIPCQKGSLAFSFEEHLRIGNIYNLQHDHDIFFHYFMINPSNIHNNYTPLVIRNVDDIELSLYTSRQDETRDRAMFVESAISPAIPVVSAIAPENGEESFDKTSPIILSFSVAMNETSVELALQFTPFISADLVWNESSTQLMIDPVDSLLASTEYTISLSTNAVSVNNVPIEEDFELVFTTEA